ncbi:MAG: Mpo1-like protein [Isosphaeraceae bacterium]
MLEPPVPPDPRVQRWLMRHLNPTSFVLHIIGIPPTFLGVLFVPIYLSLLSLQLFYVALALFLGGFLIQFAGHFLEGTDPGEIIYFKRKLGLPYVEFAEKQVNKPRGRIDAPATPA